MPSDLSYKIVVSDSLWFVVMVMRRMVTGDLVCDRVVFAVEELSPLQ